MIALTNCDIYTGSDTLMSHAVLIDGRDIVDVIGISEIPSAVEIVDLKGMNLAPGFIDLQVNGGGGHFFTEEPTVDAMRDIASAHRTFGTLYMLLAVITSPPETTSRARQAMSSYRESGGKNVLGLHFEGPLLNPSKAGAHDASMMTDSASEALIQDYLADHPTLVTLAPEVAGSELVQRLHANGTLVAAGHTEASGQGLSQAVHAGLRLGTHVFNAMGPLSSRDPGTAGCLLANDQCWASFICDGAHVDFTVLKTAFRAKPQGKALLVTDAMPCVGSDIKEFSIGHLRVLVGDDGRCVTPEGALAGSSLDMATAVRNAIQEVGVPRDEALRMASLYPAEFLGIDSHIGRIAPGYRASLVVFDNEIHVRRVIFEGNVDASEF